MLGSGNSGEGVGSSSPPAKTNNLFIFTEWLLPFTIKIFTDTFITLGEMKNGKKILDLVFRNYIPNFLAFILGSASLQRNGTCQQTIDDAGFVGNCHVGTWDCCDHYNCIHYETADQYSAIEHAGHQTVLSLGRASPIRLSFLGGLLTLLFGIAKLDLNFTMIRESMASAPGGNSIPSEVVVAIQVLIAFTLAPFINILFALGEELGWRGFLLPHLMPLGQWKAILFSGIIWGVWHIPAIAQGLNYPGYPIPGIFMMIVFCVLLGTILSWLYLNTRSPWVAALAHGSVNAVAGLPVLFLKPGFNMAIGGTLAAPVA
jgi:membrane protease YdiL (CAAX protease family)